MSQSPEKRWKREYSIVLIINVLLMVFFYWFMQKYAR